MSDNKLKTLIVSRARVSIIQLFFTSPEKSFYVREIARLTKEEVNSVRRELDRLVKTKLLRSEEISNKVYYSLNKKYLFFQELQRMVAKTTGLGLALRNNLKKLGKVEYLMFSGRFVRSMKPNPDEVEVLVIGIVVLPELQLLIHSEQERLKREINYAVFELEEFEFRKTRRDPFIMEILYSTKVMIVGDEDSFSYRQLPGLT